MSISRELLTREGSSLQKNGAKNYVSEANCIEFDNVKVIGQFTFIIYLSISIFIFVFFHSGLSF